MLGLIICRVKNNGFFEGGDSLTVVKWTKLTKHVGIIWYFCSSFVIQKITDKFDFTLCLGKGMKFFNNLLLGKYNIKVITKVITLRMTTPLPPCMHGWTLVTNSETAQSIFSHKFLSIQPAEKIPIHHLHFNFVNSTSSFQIFYIEFTLELKIFVCTCFMYTCCVFFS